MPDTGKTPFLSVIMPAYNAEALIEPALNSVLAQHWTNVEVIVVDDGSTDATGTIAESLAASDRRIRVVHQPNQGSAKAREHGVSLASGTYCTFMDADDVIEPDFYSDVFTSPLFDHQDLVISGARERIYGNGSVTDKPITPPVGTYEGEELAPIGLALERDTLFGYPWNHFYRMQTLRRLQPEFVTTALYEDYFFNMNFYRGIHSLCAVDETGYIYNKRGEQSLTNKFVPDYYQLSLRRVQTMDQYCSEHGLTTATIAQTLGPIFLRYSLSAFVRALDSRSGYTAAQQHTFARVIRSRSLYHKLIPFTHATGALGVFQRLLATGWDFPPYAMARFVRQQRDHTSQLYRRLAQGITTHASVA
ncbi:MAG: glycosyltransferase family 2 protein [Actinomycetaceae bacterium]|nr:glycosyltransferase family 2 protein [Actinomycetaceae bacterium]MDY6083619.1 glycosyltransferase family 2 protein [Actinomycetaceae bacterium]